MSRKTIRPVATNAGNLTCLPASDDRRLPISREKPKRLSRPKRHDWIKVKTIESAAAIFLALLSVCCNKSEAPPARRSQPLTVTPVAQQPPAPASVPPASPPVAGTLHFSGDVNRGQRFEKLIAPNMVFRLEPYAGNDSGWDIRIAPGLDPSAESMDCIGAISVPAHGSNDLSIELADGNDPQVSLQSMPHEFDFVPDSSDCKRAWDLNNSITYGYKLTDQERQNLNSQFGTIPYGHGGLKILDSRLGPSAGSNNIRVIDWIKFEVVLQFAQPDQSGPVKAQPAQTK